MYSKYEVVKVLQYRPVYEDEVVTTSLTSHYNLSRKQRKKMHSHLHQNQNQCVEQPNRILANGPHPPGPGPEQIPMADVSPG